MSSSRVLSVDELSEAQLRRLVSILQISHPDAVTSAMALLNPTPTSSPTGTGTGDTSNFEEKEEKSDDAVEVRIVAEATTENLGDEKATAEAEEISLRNEASNIGTNNADEIDAPLQDNTPEKIVANYVSSDDTIAEMNDVKSTESPPPKEPQIPMEPDGSLEDTAKNAEASEKSTAEEEVSPDTSAEECKDEKKEDPTDENCETNETPKDPETDDTPTTKSQPAVNDEISKTQSPDEAAAENQTVDTTQPESNNDTESPDDSQESPGEMINTVDSTVSEGAASNASSKKQKKRPPGKKRPPKPRRGSASTQDSNNETKSDEAELGSAVATETNIVETLPSVPTDSSISASDPPITSQPTEVAQEGQQEDATEITSTEELPPSPEEQLEDTNDTKVVSGSDDQQPADYAAVSESTSPLLKTEQAPAQVSESESSTPAVLPDLPDEQPDAITTPITSAEPTSQLEPEEGEASSHGPDSSADQNQTKKRPPAKKRPSQKMRSDDDKNNDAKVSRDPPGHANDSAQASGAATHEVIAWESPRADDAPTEDCFFDGYSGMDRSEHITAEAYPEAGCYLVFDSQGGGKLVSHYSKTRIAQAIGFFSPGEGYSIQGFKFSRNQGRVELIGNCASGLAGRKNYYSGWCQYIRAAKDLNATLWIYPPTEGKGLAVDVYVYLKASLPVSSVLLPENQPCCVSEVEAVACLPKHAEFISNVRVAFTQWMERGNAIGTTIQLPDSAKKAVPTTEGLFVPGKSEAPSPRKEASSASEQGPAGDMGCYLVYDADGCKLIQHYSKTRVPGAIGFFAPGPGVKIPGFKFSSNQGRAELIGNCSGGVVGRKNYYSGWCQFVRAAKAMQGTLWVFPKQEGQAGLDVDVFVYTTKPEKGDYQTIKLQENVIYNMNSISAVACLPKHAEFFDGLTMDLTRWVEEGSKVGATIQV